MIVRKLSQDVLQCTQSCTDGLRTRLPRSKVRGCPKFAVVGGQLGVSNLTTNRGSLVPPPKNRSGRFRLLARPCHPLQPKRGPNSGVHNSLGHGPAQVGMTGCE
eukprot:685314-Amphidinium_carterae.1